MYRNTYLEISLSDLYKNARSILKSYNEYKYYIGVVKSNCYGHGSYSVKALIKAGINYLAVSNLLEAKNIRKHNKTIPILCLEPINLEFLSEAISMNITLTVSSLDYLKKLEKLGKNKNLLIHLKINSGMNRLGFDDKNEVVEALTIINNFFTLEGVYTHFHTLGITDKEYDNQINSFSDITSLIDLKKVKIVHMGKSASMINHDKISCCNGVRLGIILYGVDVSLSRSSSILRRFKSFIIAKLFKISKVNYGCKAKLISSLSLISEVIEIKTVKKDSYVGYGKSYKTKKDIIVGIVSCGYADGLKTSDVKRKVYINEKGYEILGVTSGMLMIKLDEEVFVGDKVYVYGKNSNIKSIARNAKTNCYDLYSSLDKSLERVYIESEKEVYKETWEVI